MSVTYWPISLYHKSGGIEVDGLMVTFTPGERPESFDMPRVPGSHLEWREVYVSYGWRNGVAGFVAVLNGKKPDPGRVIEWWRRVSVRVELLLGHVAIRGNIWMRIVARWDRFDMPEWSRWGWVLMPGAVVGVLLWLLSLLTAH